MSRVPENNSDAITNQDALLVPCPTCQASRSQPCTTLTTGLPMRPVHELRRIRYARKLLRDAEIRNAP